MYRVIIILFLFSSCVNHSKQPTSSDADSLIVFMKTTVRPYIQSWQTDEAKRILDSLQPVVEGINKYNLTCTWLTFKSSLNIFQGHIDSARYYIDEAMAIASREDSSKKILLEVQIQYANTLKEQKLFDSALLFARDAYDLAKKIDTVLLPVICYRLYEIYGIIDDHSAMKKYLSEGFKYSDQPLFKVAFANGIADYYDRVNELDSAIAFFKTFEKDTAFSSPYFLAVKYNNLGTFLSKKGELKQALAYQLKAMAINKDIGQLSGWTFFSLAQTYRQLKDYTNAKLFLDSAMNMAEKQKDRTLVTKLWQARANLYEELHQYQVAYSTLDSALQYYHIEVDSSIAEQANELETKYTVRSKDEQIASLAFANETGDKMRNLQVWIISAMSVAIIALIVIFFLLSKRRQLKAQLHDAELEQQLLRSRMEPHFIFNTLGVLQSFIRNEDREKSIKYLSHFSRLLRLNLENSRQGRVLLKEEIEALKSYLSLQATNLENNFEYTIDVDEQLYQDKVMIPPMLIQPLVENAVVHGVAKLDYKGMINIVIKRQGDMLHCVIEDNGAGLKDNQVAEKQSHAIQLLKDRLAIIARQTKKTATVSIVDKKRINEGSGVSVILNIGFNNSVASAT